MAQSLVKLTLESNEYEAKLKQAKKSWDQFTKGLGISLGKFTAVGAAIGAVTGALKVAKDAFFKNEQQLDEWGRTVESAGSLYNGFLNSLNNGDISGFLQNIDTITEAARAAYDAMDELGTFNAFNQINTQKARTEYAESLAGFRLGNTSKEDAQKAAEAYKKELRDRQEREQEAYSQAVRKMAAERGVPWGNLEQALTGSYGDYKRLKETMPTGKRTVTQAVGQFGQTLSYDVAVPLTAEERMGDALRKLNDTEIEALQKLGAQAQRTGEEIAQIDKQLARVVNAKQPGEKGKGGATKVKVQIDPESKLEDQIRGAWDKAMLKSGTVAESLKPEDIAGPSTAWTAYTQSMAKDFETPISPLKKLEEELDKLKEELENAPDTSSYQMGLQLIADKEKEIAKFKGEEAAKELPKIGDDAAQAWSAASSAVSSVGSALGGIQNPASNIVSTIGQAVANIAMAYSEALAKDGGIKSNLWYFIASAAAATASMVATISTIHSSTGYADGGIIPGNSFSGDNQYARVNAGEVILNRAQQGNLASQLQSNYQGGNVRPYLEGETMYLGINNHTRRSGQGEIVTTGMLRRMGLM